MRLAAKRIYTAIICLFPIIYMYRSGISTLSVADLLLAAIDAWLFIEVVRDKKKINICFPLLIISLCIFFQSMLFCVFQVLELDGVMTSMRLVVYYLSCALFVKDYFDYSFAKKIIKIATLFSSLLLIIQYVAINAFGVYIQGTIPLLSTQIDDYNSIMNAHSWTNAAFARPRSCFTEPSHFALYAALGLFLYLYDFEKRKIAPVAIIIAAILLSGSGTAILSLPIVIMLALVGGHASFSRKKIMAIIGVIIALVTFYPLYSSTEAYKIFYERTFIVKDSTDGRFGNFVDAFSSEKDVSKIIIGEGVYKIEDSSSQKYITSIPRVYVYFGIIGLIIFALLSVWLFAHLDGVNRRIWTLLLFASFASEILFVFLVVPYLPFLIGGSEDAQ